MRAVNFVVISGAWKCRADTNIKGCTVKPNLLLSSQLSFLCNIQDIAVTVTTHIYQLWWNDKSLLKARRADILKAYDAYW